MSAIVISFGFVPFLGRSSMPQNDEVMSQQKNWIVYTIGRMFSEHGMHLGEGAVCVLIWKQYAVTTKGIPNR